MKDFGGFVYLSIPAYRQAAGLLRHTVSSTQEYEVVFCRLGSQEGTVFRRYSDFKHLHARTQGAALPPFPKKKWNAKPEERRVQLEYWLWGLVEEPGLLPVLLTFLDLPFRFLKQRLLPADHLVFTFLTRLHSEPHSKLSALKHFDDCYFAQQTTLAPERALVLLQHLAQLCSDPPLAPLALHTLNKLLSRHTNKAAAVLLEQLSSLPLSALEGLRLEQLPDCAAFELLQVLETETNYELLTLLNGSEEALSRYHDWTKPSPLLGPSQSCWNRAGWPGLQLEYRLREGALEVKANMSVNSSLHNVADCFLLPEKRTLWDLALAKVTLLAAGHYLFEVDAGWKRESWTSVCAVSHQPTGASLSFTGDLSVARVYLEKCESHTVQSGSDTEEECTPAVRTKLDYWERMHGALAKLFLSDVAGERQLLSAIWGKFKSVAEGDLSPTVVGAPLLQEAVRCKGLTSSPVRSDPSERWDFDDVMRDRLARRMF